MTLKFWKFTHILLPEFEVDFNKIMNLANQFNESADANNVVNVYVQQSSAKQEEVRHKLVF